MNYTEHNQIIINKYKNTTDVPPACRGIRSFSDKINFLAENMKFQGRYEGISEETVILLFDREINDIFLRRREIRSSQDHRFNLCSSDLFSFMERKDNVMYIGFKNKLVEKLLELSRKGVSEDRFKFEVAKLIVRFLLFFYIKL